jgi:hypothetical protein
MLSISARDKSQCDVTVNNLYVLDVIGTLIRRRPLEVLLNLCIAILVSSGKIKLETQSIRNLYEMMVVVTAKSHHCGTVRPCLPRLEVERGRRPFINYTAHLPRRFSPRHCTLQAGLVQIRGPALESLFFSLSLPLICRSRSG